ncbi:MAG: hypothetical protein M3R23_02625, partial [Actinomycetota bacterium]|nr:hypothetical protein [Actinomycetota bacterium]
QPLDERRLTRREEFGAHLDVLKRLLVKRKVNVVKTESGPIAGQLSPWGETEKALGISESQRKAKLGVLRLGQELLDELHDLPAEHAIQISRLQHPDHQAELAHRARELTHRQVHRIVDRLLHHPDLDVSELVDSELSGDNNKITGPLAFDEQLQVLADLCRQLARMLSNLRSRTGDEDSAQVRGLLADLRCELNAFDEAA